MKRPTGEVIMAPMTTEQRVASLEKRLVAIEGVLIEFFRNNAHQFVGGQQWVADDIQAMIDARHE